MKNNIFLGIILIEFDVLNEKLLNLSLKPED